MVSTVETIKQTAPQEKKQAQTSWLRAHETRLAPWLVVVTLIALILSAITESAGMSPVLVLILNLVSYAAGGVYGVMSAWDGLRQRKLDIDLLMILAAIGAALVNQWREGAMLLFLFSLSNVLQDYAIGRSRRAISGLMKLYPKEARVVRNGEVLTVPLEAIVIGDLLQIKPGERIPVDGLVRAGHSSVDQSPITGESMPVEKNGGEIVYAGTLNGQGALDVEATQAAQDTVLARIIRMVETAQDSKAPTERFMDRFEEIYALVIIVGVALFIVIPPALFGADFNSNFYRAMVLMTVASPCALVISTPAAFLSAIASAARRGVLFKGGAHLEMLATLKAVAFDKTGTLTRGKPIVTDILAHTGHTQDDVLQLAAAVEARSEHPLASAIVGAAGERKLAIPTVENFAAQAGQGVTGTVDGKTIRVGSPASFTDIPTELAAEIAGLQAEGKTVMIVQHETGYAGLIASADVVRPEAKAAVDALHRMGVQVAMLTGDNALTAGAIARQLGIDAVEAELMPADKVDAIKRIQAKFGSTAMIGDGVNDAPALANADVGVAMGAGGTDVALETADVVLMRDDLKMIAFAIAHSKRARRVVVQNITFSLLVIVTLVISTFVASLALPLGVLGHEGSTVIVVMNGLIQLLILQTREPV
ncbi:MAG: cadmium-translocating P-type ATPase [Pleurocapsa minor GSE-CHR-MK-17-07R]|jgi:Cd2+/Zn2+-exporting ATPase|nr:cadmium-translocating P-type ATPase [Pleurocapsa minor GSE-CHR-MK 17-07R]